MPAGVSTDYWDLSPVAQLILSGNRPVRANRAFYELLNIAPVDLESDSWIVRVFEDSSAQKLRLFLSTEKRNGPLPELKTSEKRSRFLRASKRVLESGDSILAFQDVTQVREDSEAFQAGYDEFIRVTTDLENALETIEKQNALLDQQKNILQNELQIAHMVQTRLYSQEFDRFNLVLAAGYYQAMAQLGGDMWEFAESGDSFLGVIGDVMGHGVASSLISIASKTLFKKKFEEQSRTGIDLAAMTTIINQEIMEVTGGNSFLTAGLIRIDADYKMEYLTCGHPPIIYLPAEQVNDSRECFTEQPMLGIFKNHLFYSESMQLKPGDRVFLYTDCLIESLNPDGKLLNIADVIERIRKNPGSHPKDVIKIILDYRQEFARTEELPDDLAVVCIEIPHGGQSARPEVFSVT